MSRRLLLFTCVTLSLLVTTTAFAKKGGKGGGGGAIPVEVTFRDRDSPDPRDRLGSCGLLGGTCVYIHKVNNVSATVSAEFVLKQWKKNQESGPDLYLDFRDCASATCSPPFEDEVVRAKIFRTDDYRDIVPGGSLSGSTLVVKFSVGSELYFLRFRADHWPFCAGVSNGVTVVRGEDPNPDVWTITAEEGDDVACLIGDRHLGNFRMPFQMTVEGLP